MSDKIDDTMSNMSLDNDSDKPFDLLAFFWQEGLFEMPAEMISNIMLEVASSAPGEFNFMWRHQWRRPTHDLASLATACKKFYAIFKENENAIIRRTLANVCPPQYREVFIKLGILRATKPWPVDMDEIRQALTSIWEGPNFTGPFPPAMYANTIGFFRKAQWAATDKGQFEVWIEEIGHDARGNIKHRSNRERKPSDRVEQWWIDRQAFLKANDIIVTDHRAQGVSDEPRLHPFDFVNPLTAEKVSREQVIEDAMFFYKAHAEAEVQEKEKELFRTEGYVPCCLLETCPRFFKKGKDGQEAAVAGEA
ncbi:hypothetical protein GE09DRAFT_1095074 [Coniochaeta sp. 2T2.1]|nr:hypothetical protein GE09DRAFT_1095074 [Coniochaeta sp. 2T2.1]